jgi:UDP-2,4-diacetamido-2,4,6-trideoxy-beta-L-altropyranose hydrolase
VASRDAGVVVFRTDASPAIGGGHVVRCLALAQGLRELGWRCVFAVRAPTMATVPALAHAGHSIVELRGDVRDEARELGSHLAGDAEWLGVDHYERGRTFEHEVRARVRRVLVVDDVPARAHDCELLLDQTPGREADDYRPWVPERCRLLLGPRYALLRPQFAAARTTALARRTETKSIQRILVSFGATDRHGRALIALEGIRRAGLRVAVDVTLGRGSPHAAAVHEAAERSPLQVTVREDAPDMAALMERADLAVGAAGSTAWERCCLGLPSVVSVEADNQRDIATALERAGAALAVGESESPTPEVVAEALSLLARDGDRLAAMSAAAARICDGRGAERVAEILTQA